MKPTGTTIKKEMTHKEIISIIKACGKSQVTEIQIGDLCVKFGRQTEPGLSEAIAPQDFSPAPAQSDAELQKEQKMEFDREELAYREEQLAMMLIENPSLHEELVIKGEIEKDERSEKEDD